MILFLLTNQGERNEALHGVVYMVRNTPHRAGVCLKECLARMGSKGKRKEEALKGGDKKNNNA